MPEYLQETKKMILKSSNFFYITQNAKGIIVDQCIEDYGSGLNYNRKKWNQLLDEVMEQKIKTIIVTHKDRFVRFGYDWFEKFCMKFNHE